MSDPIEHRAFFGDAERAFSLGPAEVEELERLADAGIGAIVARVTSRQFYRSDLVNVIRLGLVGGGTAPAEAAALVKTYAAGRPLAETLPLALDILMALWSGADAVKAMAELAKAAAPAPETEAVA